MKKNKKLLIILVIILVLIAAIVAVVLISKKMNSTNGTNVTDKGTNTVTQNIKVTGKLKEYIQGLTDNYYIKYYGNFKNSSGDNIMSVVHYTKDGDKYALKSDELNIHVIGEGEKLYSISHTYKMYVEMYKHSFDISPYNLISDMGQTYVKAYKETLNNKEYEVEEYSIDDNVIKYYFEGQEIKLVKYNSEEIQILRVETKTNSDFLTMPENYTYFIA